MSVSEILALINAGYSKDEIEQMGVTPEPDPAPQPEQPKPAPAEVKKKPASEPEPGVPDPKDAEIEKLKAQVKALQDAAAAGARQDKKKEVVTAESVIMDFIGKL